MRVESDRNLLPGNNEVTKKQSGSFARASKQGGLSGNTHAHTHCARDELCKNCSCPCRGCFLLGSYALETEYPQTQGVFAHRRSHRNGVGRRD